MLAVVARLAEPFLACSVSLKNIIVSARCRLLKSKFARLLNGSIPIILDMPPIMKVVDELPTLSNINTEQANPDHDQERAENGSSSVSTAASASTSGEVEGQQFR